MYARVIDSESWLVADEKVILINELIDTVKDQFFKDYRANGWEKHWLIVIYYLLRVVLCSGIMVLLFQSSGKTPCWSQFLHTYMGLVIVKLHNFSIRIDIPSWPWDLCGFNLLISLFSV